MIKKFKKHLLYFLRVPIVNRFIFTMRFFYFVRLRNRLITYQDTSLTYNPNYSKIMLMEGETSDRPLHLIRPLASIPSIESSRVLSVGSRYETELLYLVGYGFDPDQIRGLDLFSYSSWIDSGNMHCMPYKNNSFDVILLGWIISYSLTPLKLANEVIRVISNQGIVAIGVSYYSESFVKNSAAKGKSVIGDWATRLQTTDAIIALFAQWVDKIYFRYDPPNNVDNSRCIVIFSVKK